MCELMYICNSRPVTITGGFQKLITVMIEVWTACYHVIVEQPMIIIASANAWLFVVYNHCREVVALVFEPQ